LLPISSRHLIFHHFTTENPVTSTQDEARRLLSHHVATHGTNKAMAVLADIQLHGRGTQGRKWERGQQRRRQQQEEEEAEMTASSTTKTNPMMTSDGNMYLTVCIPFDRVPVFITLLPLQIGVLVAERLNHIVHACSNNSNSERQQSQLPAAVTVKWPNDVLIREQKISGTLIENAWIEMDGSTTTTAAASSSWLLIGVGINVASAPYDLSNSPGKQTRSAVCLQDVCNDQDDPIRLPDSTAWILGQDIASALADWVYVEEDEGVKDSTMMTTNTQKLERGRKVIQNWLQYAEFQKTYELRGRVVDEEQGGYQGERVITLGIQGDGQLRVKGADGRERLLVADYLF
jgi:biotin-(acetyl-CoA carboxylase) ligase